MAADPTYLDIPADTTTPVTGAPQPGSPIERVLLPVVSNTALLVAGNLGLFRALDADSPATGAQLAARLGVTEAGVRQVADLLVATGWLETDDDGYRNAPPTRRWLLPTSEINFESTLTWGFEFLDFLVELPNTIRTGKPATPIWESFVSDPAAGAVFSEFMEAKSKLTLDDIVDTIAVENTDRRLLDLGGSHGLHTTGMCRRHPQLEATIMDLPASLAHTPGRIRDAGLDDRVTVRAGNYLTDELGDQEFDLVLCFELTHCHTEQENLLLFERMHRALRPGGRVAILEEVTTGPADDQNASFSLAMFAFLATRTYTFNELSAWLGETGFERPALTRLPSGTVSLLTATRV